MAGKKRKTRKEGQATVVAAEKPLTGEEASAALKAMLDEAAPKDDEQPKPVAGNGDSKDEAEAKAAKKKVLALNEIEGEVKDGEKIRIGVEVWAGENKGGTIVAPFVVPTAWIIAGPQARPDWVHAINIDTSDRTLCRLPTDWQSGQATYPDDEYITCQPCARRLIAVKKLDPKMHEQRRAAREQAKADALKAVAARKAADKAAKAEKAKEAAPTRPSADAKPVEAKPDPKPKRVRKPKAA
jgi:hypothetical protein